MALKIKKQKAQKRLSQKNFYCSEVFTEYSDDMDDIYKNIEEYNPNKKRKILVVFDNLIADMLSNKYPVLTELFIRGRELNISCFYYTTLFCSPKKYCTKSHTIF